MYYQSIVSLYNGTDVIVLKTEQEAIVDRYTYKHKVYGMP